MRTIDLNCDLGEGAGHDAELMPLITSANVACGGHAGDRATMVATLELARAHGVAVGAHPGYADRENFGRVERDLPAAVVSALVREQILALSHLAAARSIPVRHVKPHGALYNQAARDDRLAAAVAGAVRSVDPALVLVGPPASALTRAAVAVGLRFAAEVFADRTYEPDGSLTPRARPGAVIVDPQRAERQALRLVRDGCVDTTGGTVLRLAADTICLHGDGANAVGFAQRIGTALAAAGITRKALGSA